MAGCRNSRKRRSVEFEIIFSDYSTCHFLEEIAGEERKDKDFLGYADGRSLEECVVNAIERYKNFSTRARWFSVFRRNSPMAEEIQEPIKGRIRILFYGDRIEEKYFSE